MSFNNLYNSLKIQLFIIFSITFFSIIVIFFKFDNSKIKFISKFKVHLELDRTYYGKYISLLDQEIYESIKNYKNLTIKYKQNTGNQFTAIGTKQEIARDLEIVKNILFTVNEKNYILTIEEVNSNLLLIEEMINKKIDFYKHEDSIILFYDIDGDEGDGKASLNRLFNTFSLDDNSSIKAIRNIYNINKKIIQDFSINNIYLYSRSKNKAYLIRTIFVVGLVLGFICIMLNIKKRSS